MYNITIVIIGTDILYLSIFIDDMNKQCVYFKNKITTAVTVIQVRSCTAVFVSRQGVGLPSIVVF